MHKVVGSVVALGCVLWGKLRVALGLRRAPDGWRRTVGILLRNDATRFAVSAFGLRVPAEGVGAGLQKFLSSQPDAHFLLEWQPAETLRHRRDSVDVVEMAFDAAGELRGIVPHLSEGNDLSAVNSAIVAAYNRTRTRPALERPTALLRELESSARDQVDYVRRLLSSVCVSVERVDLSDPVQRFRPPQFHTRRDLGFGFLTFVMRPNAANTAIDVWVSAHHVGLDGVPLQDLMSNLERAWGHAEAVTFPAADADGAFLEPRRCSPTGEREVDEALGFVDLSPVHALRRALNARHAADLGEPATIGAVLAWLIACEREFAGVKIASTVDIAASHGYDRDVDVVPLRPADYMTHGDEWDGFVAFAREFNRLLALSRERASPLRKSLQTAALLPAAIHVGAIKADPAALDETFGSMCITIIRDAKVFVAPMTDLGLGHGFFAIGSTELPSANGRRVTAVSVKGDAGSVARHVAILRRAVERVRQ